MYNREIFATHLDIRLTTLSKFMAISTPPSARTLIASEVLYYSFSRTKLFWLTATCRTTYGHYLRLNCDNGHVHTAARTRRDESLIIIIHKILLWESARRETKQERCAAKQGGRGVPSLLRGLLIPSSSLLAGNWSIPRREGGVLESVEQKPNHFRRLRPLGRRDADVGWRTPFHFASRSLYHRSSLLVPISYCIEPTTLLDFDQHRNRPQIYCSESAHMEASSTRLMTYRGFSSSLSDFSVFVRSSPEPVAVGFFFDCYKDSRLRHNLPLLHRVYRV